MTIKYKMSDELTLFLAVSRLTEMEDSSVSPSTIRDIESRAVERYQNDPVFHAKVRKDVAGIMVIFSDHLDRFEALEVHHSECPRITA